MSHTCSAYCVGTVHCHECLAQPDWSLAEVETDAYETFGGAFVGLRAATEADVPRWRALEGWPRPMSPLHRKAWLVFLDHAAADWREDAWDEEG